MPEISKYFKKIDASSSSPEPPVSEPTKRALSEGTSPGLHESKKLHSNFDSLSDIELDFDKEPFWVPLLFSMVDSIKQGQSDIISDISSIRASLNEIAEFKVTVNKRLDEVEASCQNISDSFDEQKTEIDDLKERMKAAEDTNKQLKEDCQKMRDDHELLAKRVDSNEQHSRNECLLLHGVAESDRESTTQKFVAEISTKLSLNFDGTAIKRSHRLGKPRTDGKPRAIIVRFWSSALRNDIFRNKKKLKGTGVVIIENLTVHCLDILKEARGKYCDGNEWSQEGRIYAKDGENKICLTA